MSDVRVAVVQAASVMFDRARGLEKTGDLLADAARGGARLAVFPEAFVGGYPKGLDFGARVGFRRPEGRRAFARYAESAVAIPSAELDRVGALARRCACNLVLGVIERDAGTLYCTVVMFAEDGRYLGKHRKLMPTASERLVWGFGDGSTLPVVETPVGRVGAAICWENYMPLLRTAMYQKGVQLYCAPTVDDRETWLPTMRHIAQEGRCFVLSACQVLRRSDCPPDYPLEPDVDPETMLIRGGSTIVGPLGEVLAEPLFEEETIRYAELELGRILEAKYDFDVVGHYARPDVFRLTVDERPRAAVTFDAPEPRD